MKKVIYAADNELPIIDLAFLVDLVGGNTELAQEMMAIFINDLPNAQQHITDAYVRKDWQHLRHHLHRLHGSLCYTGAMRLKAVASQFEKQVIAGTGDYREPYAALIHNMELTVAEYRKMMDA